MKWIRWKGLLAFAALVGVIVVFWFLLVDSYVKALIESAGTRAVGAKVQLDGADLTLFPVGLTLKRLQVTNPEEPMQNAVEVSRIAFTMDGMRLLERKVIIEEMALQGVRFGTPRKTSGAVRKVRKEKPEEKKRRLALPTLTLPSIKEVMDKADLRTLKAAQSLREDVGQTKTRWEERLRDLPDKETFEDYRKRVQEAKKTARTDPLGTAVRVKELRDDLRADMAKLKEAKEDFTKTRLDLNRRIREVARMPAEDVRRLRETYGVTPEGLGNVTRLVAGQKAALWVQRGLFWYGKIQKVFERARQEKAGEPKAVKPPRAPGLDVHVPERTPAPEFLIRRARADLGLKAGDLSGRLTDITSEQGVTGQPTVFSFSGEKLALARAMRIEGSLDHVKPGRAEDTLKVLVDGYRLSDVALGGGQIPLVVKKGLMALDLTVSVREGRLTGSLAGKLSSANLDVGGTKEGGAVLQAVRETVRDIRGLAFRASLGGTPEDYTLALSSDLDEVLKSAVLKQANKQLGAWEEKLRSAVNEKTTGELQKLKDSMGGLSGLEQALSDRLALGGHLMDELPVPGGKLKLPF
ncbi:MAG: TIGR03545 family protein [Nitrospirota bacterium]